MADLAVIRAHVERMKDNAADRLKVADLVRAVRNGEFNRVWPQHFSEQFPTSMVANFVDVVARDLAEVLAPPPTLACSVGAMKTEADKKRAEKKNRIGDWAWRQSKLGVQMMWGADQYLSWGFLPFQVDVDYDEKMAYICPDDPDGAFYENDRWGCCIRYARIWREDMTEFATKWPEAAAAVKNRQSASWAGTSSKKDVALALFIDKTSKVLFLPEFGIELTSYDHGLGFTPVVVAERPGLSRNRTRGQFDDVIWVQLARALMANLALEAGHKAVQAPLAVPDDVTELNMGPDAIIHTMNPEKVGWVKLEVPQSAFALQQVLDNEMKVGSRYPDARLGEAQASVITGKGIQALMGGFDTQIKGGQAVLGGAIQRATEMWFEVMAKLFPNETYQVNGTLAGYSYQISFIPAKDIGDDYTCDVNYGFMSGMSPQAALVAMLQARGDGLISRDTVRRQLPWGISPEQEQRDLDVEKTEDAVMQGVFAALQATGQMMANGMTQEAMQFYKAADAIIKGRQEGKPLTPLVLQALTPPEPQTPPGAPPGAPGAAPGGPGDIPGVGPDGLPPGVAPGQAGMPPGGMPSVQQLVAGFTGAKQNPSLGASVRQRLPAGA